MSSKLKYQRPALIDFRPDLGAKVIANLGLAMPRETASPGISGRSCGGGGDVSDNSCGTGNLGQTYYCVNGSGPRAGTLAMAAKV